VSYPELFEEPEGGAKHFLEDPQCLATATRNAIAISTAISLCWPPSASPHQQEPASGPEAARTGV
jgi:hypothetical protein